MKRNNTRRPI